jgi:DNA polymerase-3 subunit gamma/tau
MTLYNTYRPTKLSQIIGYENEVAVLKSLLKKPPTSMLIHGPTGSGKTTIARCFARGLIKEDVTTSSSYHEFNVAAFRGIEGVRSILEMLSFKSDKHRIILLDEIHKQTPDGMSALLKGLEEPPPRVTWILTTNKPSLIPPEILNRCVQIGLSPVKEQALLILKSILAGEKIKVSSKTLEYLVEKSSGENHPDIRDLISKMEILINYKNITEDIVNRVIGNDTQIAFERQCLLLLNSYYKKDLEQFVSVSINIRHEAYMFIHALLNKNREILNVLLSPGYKCAWASKMISTHKITLPTCVSLHQKLQRLRQTPSLWAEDVLGLLTLKNG